MSLTRPKLVRFPVQGSIANADYLLAVPESPRSESPDAGSPEYPSVSFSLRRPTGISEVDAVPSELHERHGVFFQPIEPHRTKIGALSCERKYC